MRILTVSDVVVPELRSPTDRSRFFGVELVLACGDLPPEYLAFLAGRFGTPLYFVRGNHDIREAKYPPAGCLDLHGNVSRHKGLILAGLEGSRWYNGGPHQYGERHMRRLVRALEGRLRRFGRPDIVITHAPPRHVHDEEDPCHTGFESFRWLMDKVAPRYLVHGHIHRRFDREKDRTTVVGRTRVVNTYGCHLLDIAPQTDLA
jgi:Icc-related predicted phosphoesterase